MLKSGSTGQNTKWLKVRGSTSVATLCNTSQWCCTTVETHHMCCDTVAPMLQRQQKRRRRGMSFPTPLLVCLPSAQDAGTTKDFYLDVQGFKEMK